MRKQWMSFVVHEISLAFASSTKLQLLLQSYNDGLIILVTFINLKLIISFVLYMLHLEAQNRKVK